MVQIVFGGSRDVASVVLDKINGMGPYTRYCPEIFTRQLGNAFVQCPRFNLCLSFSAWKECQCQTIRTTLYFDACCPVVPA